VRHTLFISDLHLTSARPQINRVFFEFLTGPAREAEALYILGDLFEYWPGDDDLADPFNASVAAALRELSTIGVALFLMHGNRDLLLMDRFARAAALELIPDPTVADLYGTRTLLMHGDSLCTDDVRYQRFRAHARRPLVQRLFLLQPLWLRKFRIERARRRSDARKRNMSAQIMDVNSTAVERAFRASGCMRMIHGHTHRPARHEVVFDGRACERWVLSDWYHHGQYLRVSSAGAESFELPAGTQ
jgi:UDP-2,3-diacylglucosamine hydrolase